MKWTDSYKSTNYYLNTVVLKSLAGAMRKEKGIQIKKEEAKVYLQIIDWLKIY